MSAYFSNSAKTQHNLTFNAFFLFRDKKHIKKEQRNDSSDEDDGPQQGKNLKISFFLLLLLRQQLLLVPHLLVFVNKVVAWKFCPANLARKELDVDVPQDQRFRFALVCVT